MKKSFLYIAFFLVVHSFTAQTKVNWLNFEEAIALNKKNPKPILIDVYTNWCGYCKKMDKETYGNEVIAKYINEHFYAIKLDGEGKKPITYKNYTFKYKEQGRAKFHELSAALLEGKLAYPATIFMNEKEELLQKIPGYLSAERFEKILAFFKTDAYLNEDWVAFEKNFKGTLTP